MSHEDRQSEHEGPSQNGFLSYNGILRDPSGRVWDCLDDADADDAAGLDADWQECLLWAEGELPANRVTMLQRRVAVEPQLATKMQEAFAMSAALTSAAAEPVDTAQAHRVAQRASSLINDFVAQPAETRRGRSVAAPSSSFAWMLPSQGGSRLPLYGAAAAMLVLGMAVWLSLRPGVTKLDAPLAMNNGLGDNTATIVQVAGEPGRGDSDPNGLTAEQLAAMWDVSLTDDDTYVSAGDAYDGESANLARLDRGLQRLRSLDDTGELAMLDYTQLEPGEDPQ